MAGGDQHGVESPCPSSLRGRALRPRAWSKGALLPLQDPVGVGRRYGQRSALRGHLLSAAWSVRPSRTARREYQGVSVSWGCMHHTGLWGEWRRSKSIEPHHGDGQSGKSDGVQAQGTSSVSEPDNRGRGGHIARQVTTARRHKQLEIQNASPQTQRSPESGHPEHCHQTTCLEGPFWHRGRERSSKRAGRGRNAGK